MGRKGGPVGMACLMQVELVGRLFRACMDDALVMARGALCCPTGCFLGGKEIHSHCEGH